MAQVLIAKDVRVECFRLRRQRFQDAVLASDDGAQTFAQMIGVEELPHAHATAAADLVLVTRTDAPAWGADGLLGTLFAQALFFHATAENHMRMVVDGEFGSAR